MLSSPTTHQIGLACAQQIGHAQHMAPGLIEGAGVRPQAWDRRSCTFSSSREQELGLASDDSDGAKVADETQCHGAVLLSTSHARLGGIDSARQTTSCVTFLTGGHRGGGGALKGT